MALNSKFSSTFDKSIDVYTIVAGFQSNRLNKTVVVSLAVFENEAARNAYKEAQASIADIAAQVQAKRIAQATAQDQATSESIDRDIRALQVQFEGVQAKLRTIKAVDDPNQIQIGPDKIAAVLDADGDVSTAAVYTYLKTLDRFKDAKDAQGKVKA